MDLLDYCKKVSEETRKNAKKSKKKTFKFNENKPKNCVIKPNLKYCTSCNSEALETTHKHSALRKGVQSGSTVKRM